VFSLPFPSVQGGGEACILPSEAIAMGQFDASWNGRDYRVSEPEPAVINRLLTLKKVAEILDVKPYRAAELVRLKILKGVYPGRQVRVNAEELRRFIAEGGKTLEQLGQQQGS
jgi:hypothetical protein